MLEECQLSVVPGPLRYAPYSDKVNLTCHGRCTPPAIPNASEFSEYDELGQLLSTTVELDFDQIIEQNCRLYDTRRFG